jgi:hypothetical protein
MARHMQILAGEILMNEEDFHGNSTVYESKRGGNGGGRPMQTADYFDCDYHKVIILPSCQEWQ